MRCLRNGGGAGRGARWIVSAVALAHCLTDAHDDDEIMALTDRVDTLERRVETLKTLFRAKSREWFRIQAEREAGVTTE